MIRVLHSVSNMDRAGIETMLMNYYRHIDKKKIQFDFLCNKKKKGAYDEEIIQMGGRIYHSPGTNPIKYLQYLKYMKEVFAQYPENYIVEAHNGALGVYALHAAKVNNIPVRIFHAHGASISKDWKLLIKLICKAFLPQNINCRFSCSIAAAKCYFGDNVVESNDYELISNAIEVERFVFNKDTRNRIREEHGLKDKHIIGHVGRFMSQKNHIFLLKVFGEFAKRDPKAMLVLLGDGELQGEIRKKVELKGLINKVCFVGNVSNANEWYNVFDVFVLPSVWEGLPVVGVEAQANDLPCVFSDNITKEIVLSEKVEFVSLQDPIALWVKVISEKMKNEERKDRTQMITNNNYNIALETIKLQERYLKLYEEKNENRYFDTPLY